jgi:SdpC family antimicrobial peptide
MKKNQILPVSVKTTLIGLLVALLVSSCDKSELAEIENSASEKNKSSFAKKEFATVHLFDDSEVFKQIMFARGESIKIIPELQRIRDLSGIEKLDDEQQKFASLIEDAIADQIKKSNPEFFKKFATLIRSGNPVKVQHGLRIASEQIVEAMSKSNPELSLLNQLRKDGDFYASLTPEQKKRLSMVAELDNIDFAKLRDIFKDLDIGTNIYRNVQINSALVLQHARQVQLDLNINLHNQLVKNFNIQLDRNINIARQLHIQRAFNTDLHLNFDTGAGSSVWHDTDVVVVAYVAVAVVAVAVVNVIDFTPMPGPEFSDKILFQEKLVAGITKNFSQGF